MQNSFAAWQMSGLALLAVRGDDKRNEQSSRNKILDLAGTSASAKPVSGRLDGDQMRLLLERGSCASTSYKGKTFLPATTRPLDHFADLIFQNGFEYFGALAIAFGHGLHEVKRLFGSDVPRQLRFIRIVMMRIKKCGTAGRRTCVVRNANFRWGELAGPYA